MKVLELERSGINEDESVNLIGITLSPAKWKSDFYMKRKEIFELWDACHVSIIHRSQFYLLFRGDPADAIYIEVELRRLTWLRNHHLKPTRKAGRESHVSSPVLRYKVPSISLKGILLCCMRIRIFILLPRAQSLSQEYTTYSSDEINYLGQKKHHINEAYALCCRLLQSTLG